MELLELIYFLNFKSAPSHSSKTFTAKIIATRFTRKKEILNKNEAFSVHSSIESGFEMSFCDFPP
jgi:hypothetical protein